MIPVPTVQTQRVPLHVPVILGTVGMETPVKVNCLIYTYRMFYDQKKKNLKTWTYINSLPKDDFLEWTKFKSFADDKSNVGAIIISGFDSVENIVGEGENGYQPFLLFPQCFQKAIFLGVVKNWNCVVKSNTCRPVTLNPTTQMMFEFYLTLSQTRNFRLFQTERVCRQQF